MTLDATTLAVPDTPANAARFGRPGAGRGRGRALFCNCGWSAWSNGTHAVLRVALESLRVGDRTAAQSLLGALDATMLILADRGSYRAALAHAAAAGAALLSSR